MATAKKAAPKVETLVEDAQKTANETFEKMTKSTEDMMVFAQDNYEAFVKAAEIAAKAAEGVNAEVVAFTKKTVEEGVAATKEMAEIKTIPEFVERQQTIAKTVFENYVAQTTKINEMTAAALQDVFAPINARAEAAADLAKTFRA